MNLLDKKLRFGAFVLALTLFISCEETGDFGLDDDDISPVDFFSETIDVTSAVLLIDSIPSDDTQTLLVGNISNNDFGTTEARAFAKLNLNRSSLVPLFEDVVLDSVQMNIRFNYIHNPEQNVIDLTLREVATGQILDIENYLTTSDQPTLKRVEFGGPLVEIGRQTFAVEDLDSTYVLDINSEWATTLFELLKANDPIVVNQGSFESTFFGGLAFISGPSSTGAFGIEATTFAEGETAVAANLVFYFSQTASNGTSSVGFQHALTFGNAKHFYTLTTDRTGADTEIVEDSEIAYEPPSGLRYIQEGNAIVTKLDISAFGDFSEANPDVTINFGEMTIGPLEERPAENGSPPNELVLYLTDSKNTLIPDRGAFRGVQRDATNQLGSSATITMIYDSETNSYKSSLTSFLQAYHAGSFQRNELILFTTNMDSSLDGMVLDPDNIKIKIFYSQLK